MIKYESGNLLENNAQALVNTVNCVGVMGRGIALQFKNAFPDNFDYYRRCCKTKGLQLGRSLVFRRNSLYGPEYIINFPTKYHWREKSSEKAIVAGLTDLVNIIRENNIRSVAIPPLGCGLGGLKWERVKPLIEEKLGSSLHDVDIIVFEPTNPMALKRETHSLKKPPLTKSMAYLILLMKKYRDAMLDPEVTLLELQKLVYFGERLGANMGFKFVKSKYGPYTTTLSHILNRMEGHYTTGYDDGGDRPLKALTFIGDPYEEAKKIDTTKESIFLKLSKLIEGLENPYGLELLASVDWILMNECPSDDEDLVKKFHAWSRRKSKFPEKHILIAKDRLKEMFQYSFR